MDGRLVGAGLAAIALLAPGCGGGGGVGVSDDYSSKPDGPFAVADSEQEYEFAQRPPGAASAYRIVDGAATSAYRKSGSATASYAQVPLPDGNMVSATFGFLNAAGDPIDPASAAGQGSVMIGAWAGPFPPGYAVRGIPPNSPCHLVVTEQGKWALRLVYEGVVVPPLASGTMIELPAFPWTATVVWTDDEVVFRLPDGTIHRVEDEAGRIEEILAEAAEDESLRVAHEIFAADAAADAKPVIYSWRAEDTSEAWPDALRDRFRANGGGGPA